MTEAQIWTSALPSVATMIVVLVGILNNNVRLSDLRSQIEQLDRKMDQRFEDMKAMWRSELHRVDEVLDARLKHLEER